MLRCVVLAKEEADLSPHESIRRLALLADGAMALDLSRRDIEGDGRILYARTRTTLVGNPLQPEALSGQLLTHALPSSLVDAWLPVMEDALSIQSALPCWYSLASAAYDGWLIRTGLVLPLPSKIVLLLAWHRGLRHDHFNGSSPK